MVNIFYFYAEKDWRSVIPESAKNFCKWLDSQNNDQIIENKICISERYENLTKHIWVTCNEDFISKFPELKEIIKTRPWYSEFLDYKEENFGLHNLEPKNPEKDMTDYVC